MSKWREIRYYVKGTPTKTTIWLRRMHLFTMDDTGFLTDDPIQSYHSACGLHILASQMSESFTATRLCGNCVKALCGQEKKETGVRDIELANWLIREAPNHDKHGEYIMKKAAKAIVRLSATCELLARHDKALPPPAAEKERDENRM